MVQVVTGDSQEEVLIFRDRQTDTSPLYIYHHCPHIPHHDDDHQVDGARHPDVLECQPAARRAREGPAHSDQQRPKVIIVFTDIGFGHYNDYFDNHFFADDDSM